MSSLETAATAVPVRKKSRWRLALKLCVVIALVAVPVRYFRSDSTTTPFAGTTFTVARGNLKVDITEGGSIEALESQEIKSEVQGQTKILSIVEEGYSVTPEDVANGKILVELDATELLEKQIAEELEYQNSLANYTESREAFEIQLNQNHSDITQSELEVKFALMDLEKFMGKDAAHELLALLPKEEPMQANMPMPNMEQVLENVLAAEGEKEQDKPEGQTGDEQPATAVEPAAGDESAAQASEESQPAEAEADAGDADKADTSVDKHKKGKRKSKKSDAALEGNKSDMASMASSVLKEATSSANTATARYAEAMSQRKERISIDFAKYANIDVLGDGEAGQRLRKLEDDAMMQQSELSLAKKNFEGTLRLSEKEFVTKNELETEQLKMQRNEVAVQSAETSRELFLKYEFPKQAEKLLSDYQESLRKLERAKKVALSKLAQSEARLKSTEARFALQTRKRRDRKEQIEKCKIKAERPGLVVYANQESWRGEDRVQEGAMVHERQKIITIPDMNQMGAKVNIHESAIKQVQRGQKATITVDAYPDNVLHGEVVKVGVLPDSENRWLNPDLKVYETSVSIPGINTWLKPGMSAQIEIHIKELTDVVYVPIQAVTSNDGHRVCYVSRLAGPEKRVVETGESNNEFIEIKSGLEPGEVVLLRAPVTPEEMSGEKKEGESTDSEEKKEEAEKPSGDAAAPAAS